jgi:hypothetical protein
MMSMGLRRAPGMIQGVGQRAVQGAREGARLVAENPTMREALLQTVPTKSVSEILSEPLGEMMPDLGGATSSASRQRQIADMLLQGAQSQDNTSIAGGLSQLGQAFLARKAGQKADTAEDKQREMANLLLQQAMGQGPESQAARAQIFADSPAALIAQSDAQRTAQAEQQRTQMQNEMLANLYPEGSKERAMILAGVGTTEAAKQAFAPAPEAKSASSPLGKIAADLQAGFITQEQADAAIAKATAQSAGIRVGADGSFQIGGPVDGIGYGSGAKGQEPAFVRTREGGTAVTPGPQQEAYNKARRGLDEFVAQNSIVLGDIDMALKNVSAFSTGAGSVLKDLPVVGGITPAGQMESLMETIRANVGFDKLQAMREASPTGGALGAVTEKELAFLQSVFGSLRQDISPENVTRNLTRLKEHMVGREQRIQEAFAADFPTVQETAQFRTQTNDQVQRLKFNSQTGEFE